MDSGVRRVRLISYVHRCARHHTYMQTLRWTPSLGQDRGKVKVGLCRHKAALKAVPGTRYLSPVCTCGAGLAAPQTLVKQAFGLVEEVLDTPRTTGGLSVSAPSPTSKALTSSTPPHIAEVLQYRKREGE
jgi:cytolysin (calcineurin-like family phosphatase)